MARLLSVWGVGSEDEPSFTELSLELLIFNTMHGLMLSKRRNSLYYLSLEALDRITIVVAMGIVPGLGVTAHTSSIDVFLRSTNHARSQLEEGLRVLLANFESFIDPSRRVSRMNFLRIFLVNNLLRVKCK